MNSEMLILDQIVNNFFPEEKLCYDKLTEDEKNKYIRALNNYASLTQQLKLTKNKKDIKKITKEMNIVLGGIKAVQGLGSTEKSRKLIKIGAQITIEALKVCADIYLSKNPSDINNQIAKVLNSDKDIDYLAQGLKLIDFGAEIYKTLKEE